MQEDDLTDEDIYDRLFLTVDPGQQPLRIDKFLMDRLWRVSRNKIQAAITAGAVQVNGGLVKANYKVKPADKIEVVNQGADERFAPASDDEKEIARAKYKLPDRYVLYYGTIEPRKNLERLIAAWSSIADKFDQHLVIAGRTGWKTQPITDCADRSPHRARIHFPGFIADEDLPAVISAADVVALPSLYEGFGNAIQEGMACGVSVLTSNNSSMPEVAGGAAVLIDPLNAESIADGLQRLLNDPTLRAECIAKGKIRAAQLSWTKTAEGALRVYRSVAST